METMLKSIEQMGKIEDKIQELNAEKTQLVEKNVIDLKTRINMILTKFNKKYDPVIEKVLIIGKRELDILYDAYEFLRIENEFGMEFNDNGLISKVWGMTIYASDDILPLGVFGKADNIIFVDR